MLKYNLPKGDIKVEDAIPLIVEALYPSENRKLAIKRVRQAINYGRAAKKNPLQKGGVLPEKEFWEWAVNKWPSLPEHIEGIPRYVEMTGAIDGMYKLDAFNIDNPEDLKRLIDTYMKKRIQEDNRTGDDVADLKRAYVLAEREVGKYRNEIDLIKKENDEYKKKLEERNLSYEEWKLSSGRRGEWGDK